MTTPQQFAGQVYDPYTSSFTQSTSDVQPTDGQPDLTTAGLWSPTNYGESGPNGQFFLNDYQFATNVIGIDGAALSNIDGNAYDYGYQTNVQANQDFQQNSETQNGGKNPYLAQFDQTEYKAQFSDAMMQSFQDFASYHNYGSNGPMEPWEDQVLTAHFDGMTFPVKVNIFGDHPRQVTSGYDHYYALQAEQFDNQLTQEGEAYAKYEATKSDLPTKTVTGSSSGSGTGYRVNPSTVTQTGTNLEDSQGNVIGSALEQFASGASAAFGNFPFGSEDASYIQAYRNALTFLAGLRKSVVQIGAGLKNGAKNYTGTSKNNAGQFSTGSGTVRTKKSPTPVSPTQPTKGTQPTTQSPPVREYQRPEKGQQPGKDQQPRKDQQPSGSQQPTTGKQTHGEGKSPQGSSPGKSGKTSGTPEQQQQPTGTTRLPSGKSNSGTSTGTGKVTKAPTASSSSGNDQNRQQYPTSSKTGSTDSTVPASSGSGQSHGQGTRPEAPSSPKNTSEVPPAGTGTATGRTPSRSDRPDGPTSPRDVPMVPPAGTVASTGGSRRKKSRPDAPSTTTRPASTPPGGSGGAGTLHGHGGASGDASLSGADLPGPGGGAMLGGFGLGKGGSSSRHRSVDGPPNGGRSSSGSRPSDDQPEDPLDTDEALTGGEIVATSGESRDDEHKRRSTALGGSERVEHRTDEALTGGEIVATSGESRDDEHKRRSTALGGSGRVEHRSARRRGLGSSIPSIPFRQTALEGLPALTTSSRRRDRKRRTPVEHLVVKDWLVFFEASNVVLGGAHRSRPLADSRPRVSSELSEVAPLAQRGALPGDASVASPELSPLVSSVAEPGSGDLGLESMSAKFSESAIFLAHKLRSRSWSALVEAGGGRSAEPAEEAPALELVGASRGRSPVGRLAFAGQVGGSTSSPRREEVPG
jgi:hypothetical protein